MPINRNIGARDIYLNELREGRIPEERQARFCFSKQETSDNETVSLGFMAAHEDMVSATNLTHFELTLIKLEGLYLDTYDWTMPTTEEEAQERLIELGLEFIECVKRYNVQRFEEIIDSGFNVNFVHPKLGVAAIHLLARTAGQPGMDGRSIVDIFMKADDINFLLKTEKSQETASMIARRNPVGRKMYEFWCEQEQRQATRDAIDWADYTKDWHDPFASPKP